MSMVEAMTSAGNAPRMGPMKGTKSASAAISASAAAEGNPSHA